MNPTDKAFAVGFIYPLGKILLGLRFINSDRHSGKNLFTTQEDCWKSKGFLQNDIYFIFVNFDKRLTGKQANWQTG
jgi:hypothetical protein